ncbi:hypothetical protein A8C56_07900 [Niabella ginsenosidivorans]|uniref:Apea-like HEPN domain-containing protein n=1 Tax=Niabella ginsenosidivorans TaxID=1176587 RepID=A0A1A9I2W9_9BACT|nr:hypothetical protein [Niabella ginsenosidivorans]ANH80914.1 hypothetical protein A8C56_07900 [Niabella ginsenosidivorans]
MLSIEFGLAYSQCYKALETLLKDLIHLKIESDKTFKCLWLDDKEYSREHLKGGEEIFKLVKKAGGDRFKKYSKENAPNFRFKEMFKVFSEVRHSIIHSKGVFKTSRLPGNEYYKMLFEFLLPLNKFEGEFIPLKFEYKVVDRILMYLAEFGYQIFKILSEEDNYEWNYKKLQPKFEI